MPWSRSYSPDEPKPLSTYGALTLLWGGAFAGVLMSFLRAPFTRYVDASDRPSEVTEEPRGRGLQFSNEQLLVCPYCLSQWIGAGFLAAYLRQPRMARTAAALFAIVGGSDLLQQTWVAVDKRA